MITVTKSFLPDIEEYFALIRKVWESGHLTNHGPLVNELEEKIKDYLGVKYFYYVNNGTIALQIAIKALGLSGEVITTPFSYVATTSCLVWESCTPVFADIDPETLTIDPAKIEAAITPRTTAILATHVYGIPCDVARIEEIAKRHNLRVIYDAAHAFGVTINNSSVLNYGDISTLSFHATKLFHTVEGGGIATNDRELARRISYMRNFGHNGPEDFFGVGINGKSSEFHAAMGLCLLPHLGQVLAKRKLLSEKYETLLKEENVNISRPKIGDEVAYNYSYFPILFESEAEMLTVKNRLAAYNIHTRRYFYPSLNTLNYVAPQSCPVSEDVSTRVLCLPLYPDLTEQEVSRIVRKIAFE